MKTTIALLAGIALLSLSAIAGDSPSDGLTGHFFPPEALMQAHERIGLTDEQKKTLRATMERTHSRFEELKQRVERETTALAEVAKPEPRGRWPAGSSRLSRTSFADQVKVVPAVGERKTNDPLAAPHFAYADV